ncbi:MAG: O-antigen ligase domain-containing protein, partial [Planctomycetaceae bacterium]
MQKKEIKKKQKETATTGGTPVRRMGGTPMPQTTSMPRERFAVALEFLAMAILLAIVAARPFLGEMPYNSVSLSAMAAGSGGDTNSAGDHTELARVTFAIGLLGAFACWMLAGAARGRLTVRFAWLGVLIKAFAIITFLSALWAGDKRAALDSWIEQVSLLAAAFWAAQLFADRKRFVILLILLSAVGATLAAKAYWQYFVEVPERISQFREHGDEQLQQAGLAPGTPMTQAFTGRALERTALGYGGLANIFASMLIVLATAAIGLAGAKLSAAMSALAAWKARQQAGEIYVPLVAAVVSIVLAAASAGAIFLTGSRAGMVLGAAAFLAGGAVYRFRNRLARRWKRNVGIAAVGVILCLAGITAYGIKYDSLPAKSLTFRWHYWTASAEIAAQHPLLGVGPGNFPDAYLQARRPAAEEAVKMPHNVLAHAFSEYGIPGGTLFIAIIAGMLVAMCRPKKTISDCGLRIADLTAETTKKATKETTTTGLLKSRVPASPKGFAVASRNGTDGMASSILVLLVPLISVPLARLL